MTTTAENNKRIAKNTLLLYMRMFVMLFIGLFTSRVVLNALGVDNYGINNVVGGVVAMFSFVSSSMSGAISRFTTFTLGTGDKEKLNHVFCTGINIMAGLGLIFLLLTETIGVWFLNTQMNIPEGRMFAANVVLQFSILSFVIGLLCAPYGAAIIAHEKMSAFAYMTILDATFKLLVAFLLTISPIDVLIFYCLLNFGISLLMRFIYNYYSKRHFEECTYHFIIDKPLLKEMTSFAGWSFFGNIASLLAQQGLNILLNIFHGVTLNAAAGVANSVCGHVNAFISNFRVAYQPQIVKNYASNDMERFNRLLFQTSKFTYYLFLVIAIPVMFTLDSLLSIWLVEVPFYTSEFCRLILVFMAIDAINAPLWYSVQATGNIRNYQILITPIMFLNFPFAYLVLKMGMPPYSIWYVRIIVNLIAMVARWIYIKRAQGFPLRSYFYKVLVPALFVTTLALPIPLFINYLIEAFWVNLFVVGLTSLLSTMVIVYRFGMSANERTFVKQMISSKLMFIKHKQ